MPTRMCVSAMRAATSCPPSPPRISAGSAGWPTPCATGTSAAPPRPGRPRSAARTADHVQMERLAAEGVTVLVPPDANTRPGARPVWNGGLYAFMRRVLATDQGGALYAKRQGMIEPVFADTKFNRGIDRFLRRGRAAARSEWRLTNTAHNLLKLWRHTTAPAAA